MNHDTFVFFSLSAVSPILIAIIGFLIKSELHDIKNRLMRLEGVFIQQRSQ